MTVDKSGFRRQPQQQRSQQRVEAILQAAAEVFWEVGYEAATTHAIARKAQTAVGTLYRFFPNKLAIFHELEKRHRQCVERLQSEMMTPELMQQPLAQIVQNIVETFADYFEDLGPRVVYVQYFTAPEMFVHFDDAVDYGFIRRFAIALRFRNPALSIEKSELVAEVVHRTYNALLLTALKSDAAHRSDLYLELQALLTQYLQTYDIASSDDTTGVVKTVDYRLESLAKQYDLSDRQKVAVEYVLQHGSLTIQAFERLCPERSRRTLQRDLKQLISQKLLQSEGDTNQLTYRLNATE